MKVLLIALAVLMVQPNTAFASKQTCTADNCIQIGKNYGTINFEGLSFQININNGVVNFIRNPADIAKITNFEKKVSNFEAQINRYLAKLSQQENRRFTEKEQLHQAMDYANKLLAQIDQLSKRIALLDQQHALVRKILAAKDLYDVPLIKKLLKEKQQLDDKVAAETAFELAQFQNIDLEFDKAYSNHKKAVYLANNNAVYLNEAGLQAIILADLEQAVAFFESALTINLKTLGNKHRTTKITLQNLGTAWHEKGDYAKALNYYEQAGADPQTAAIATSNHSPQVRDNKKALRPKRNTLDKTHPEFAGARRHLGLVWHYSGAYNKAIGFYQLAMRSNIATFGRSHLSVARNHNNLGLAWQAKGNNNKAINNFKQALAICKTILGKAHPKTLIVANNLTKASNTTGNNQSTTKSAVY